MLLACLLLLTLSFAISILLLASGIAFLQDVLIYSGYLVLAAAAMLTCMVIVERLSSKRYTSVFSGSLVLSLLLSIAFNWNDLAVTGSFYLAGMLSSVF